MKDYEIKAGADLRGADLSGMDLREADLCRADLRMADLHGVNLRGADLRRVYLNGADLRGADLDYSCWPLWCGSKDIKVDKRIFTQLLAHICCLKVEDGECREIIKKILPLARKSHIAEELLGGSKE